MKERNQRREEIAISLLQGKLVLREKAGYDPGGFRKKEVEYTVGGALDMAEELMKQNQCYDGHAWKWDRIGGDPTNPESSEQVAICQVCGVEK
jgi:hypothetical protein